MKPKRQKKEKSQRIKVCRRKRVKCYKKWVTNDHKSVNPTVVACRDMVSAYHAILKFYDYLCHLIKVSSGIYSTCKNKYGHYC